MGGKIDTDNDGRGEYGTFLELTGSVGVRKGFSPGEIAASDFSTKGTPVNPAIMSKALAGVLFAHLSDDIGIEQITHYSSSRTCGGP